MIEVEIDKVEATFMGQNYTSVLTAAGNSILSDEPTEIGGQNKGFNPFELVIAGLASCTIATIKMYVDRKGWEIDSLEVKVELETSATTKPLIKKNIIVKSSLLPEQLKRIAAVGNACPTHKLLSGGITIESTFTENQ